MTAPLWHQVLSWWGLDTEKAPKAFPLPGSRPHYSPDRPAYVRHIALDLRLDLQQQSLQGTCAITLEMLAPEVRTLTLNAMHLTIDRVTCSGSPLAYSYDGQELHISLEPVPAPGSRIVVEIAYGVRQPQRGIYFIGPSEAYPDKPVQVWTQGEDEDSRYWFPCFDYPGQLATSELRVAVPAPYVALSNGLLVARQEQGSQITYHWRQEQVHPSYLMTLVVGDFAVLEDHWQGIPVTYYVERGREEDGGRTLGKTPRMLQFFSDYYGYPYPYGKYGQACVADFIFGGMENTSMTLLTDRCLLDERAALDTLWSETLVAHELAHQWFGDLVVIKHWSHAWVKEGMATYAEILWDEQEHGRDHADYHRYQDQQAYIQEDSSRYRRPMVTHIYRDAIELYDCHIYQKGGWVYHMIRTSLGEAAFRASLRHFLHHYAHQTVETQDLLRTIEQVTGRNLAPLFDQYVWRGGYPQFKLDYAWDGETKLAKVTITQTQGEDHLFDLQIPILLGWADRPGQTFSLHLHQASHTFYLPVADKPEFVCFDPGNHWLKTLDLNLGIPELKAQLLYAPDVISRLYAAQALGKKRCLPALEALELALQQASFWGVKVGICQALGEIALQQAIPILTRALGDASPHVRKAAIQALATYPHQPATYEPIRQLLEQGDPSYYVESAAAAALGQLLGKDPRQPDPQPLLELLDRVMASRAGWNEVSRSGVMQAWAALKHAPQALDHLITHTQPGIPVPLRLAAIRALGTYAADQEHPRVLATLQALAQESTFQVQMAVVSALGSLNTAKALPILESLKGADGRLHRAASEAIERVQSRLGSEPSLQELRREMQSLKEKNQELLSRLEALEAKSKSSS
ncbi:MAG: M1 family aminopeptidase [Thermostichales cyanobacterium SZTDM-1c_bins_54]